MQHIKTLSIVSPEALLRGSFGGNSAKELATFSRPLSLSQNTVARSSISSLRAPCFVGERGLEPPSLAAPAPKAGVVTNFTTRPTTGSILA